MAMALWGEAWRLGLGVAGGGCGEGALGLGIGAVVVVRPGGFLRRSPPQKLWRGIGIRLGDLLLVETGAEERDGESGGMGWGVSGWDVSFRDANVNVK